MSTKCTRKLTRKEFSIFQAMIGMRSYGSRACSILGIIIVSIGVMSGLVAATGKEISKGKQNALIAVFGLIGCVLAYFVDAKTKWSPLAKKLLVELKNGFASVEEFEVTDAVRVQEYEDNGYAFYLKLIDRRVLYLTGQCLYEITDQREFPCSALKVTYTSMSRYVLTVECGGNYIAPKWILPSATIKEYEAGAIPDNGSVMDIDFEALKV